MCFAAREIDDAVGSWPTSLGLDVGRLFDGSSGLTASVTWLTHNWALRVCGTRLPREERTGPARERQCSASAVSPSGHPGRFHPDGVPRDAIPRLAPGAALIVSLLLSLGLWGTVWLAVSALAAMWPW